MRKKNKMNNFQKGTSLFYAFLFISIIIAISVGLTSILISQLKLVKGMGDSVVAFYAADSGIEYVLRNRTNPVAGSGVLSNGALYNITVQNKGTGDCIGLPPGYNFCIKSVGTYKKSNRAIRINQ